MGEEISDAMQCINHPHRKNPNGNGICAFCLQEKLGKLVSSSFPLPITVPSSSSSSPPSPPRSNNITIPTPSSLPPKNNNTTTTTTRLPFLLPKKKNKKPSSMNTPSSDVVLKRSKSTATPRRTHFIDAENEDFRKRNGFWSFLYLSSSKPSVSCSKKLEANSNSIPRISSVKQKLSSEEEEGYGSLDQRRVSRSRSVGCGSRSFSGDLFERISTGFGDCTLRRVESQREGNKVISGGGNMNICLKERVKCGGIFGGFMMMTTSSTSNSTSSSNSSYWVSSDGGVNGEKGGRNSNSWGWALASPIRAFTTKKKDASSSSHNKNNNNSTPDLSAIASLLTITT